MAGPFPGMDPWLEHPLRWPDVHNSLIAALATRLGPRLRPRYFVALEERIYSVAPEGLLFVGRPDLAVHERDTGPPAGRPEIAAGVPARAVVVEVPVPDERRETWLEVRAVGDGEVVCVLEILSPSNKARGEGRRVYEGKRLAVLGSLTSLVEIDLLRGGEPMVVYGESGPADYRLLLSRGDRRPRAELLPFSVRDPIPPFTLPLRPGDEEPLVDLGGILADLYGTRAYDLVIDYRSDPVPPLEEPDAAWADEALRTAGRR